LKKVFAKVKPDTTNTKSYPVPPAIPIKMNKKKSGILSFKKRSDE